MHVMLIYLYFKVLSCYANFIFIGDIKWNKWIVKVCMLLKTVIKNITILI